MKIEGIRIEYAGDAVNIMLRLPSAGRAEDIAKHLYKCCRGGLFELRHDGETTQLTFGSLLNEGD